MARSKKSSKAKVEMAESVQARLLDGMHQVWLAGLGAVSKAQRGAPQLLDELVTEGARVHARTRASAEKALRGALGGVQSSITDRLGNVREQATDAYDNLEQMFQTRVRRALSQLGVPSAEDVAALSKRVDTLNANIERLAGKATTRGRAGGARRESAASAAHS